MLGITKHRWAANVLSSLRRAFKVTLSMLVMVSSSRRLPTLTECCGVAAFRNMFLFQAWH